MKQIYLMQDAPSAMDFSVKADIRTVFSVLTEKKGIALLEDEDTAQAIEAVSNVAVWEWVVLQCGAVWCSVVQCGAVCCSVLRILHRLLRLSAMRRYGNESCCSMLQRVAACCSVLQCVEDTAQAIEAVSNVAVWE